MLVDTLQAAVLSEQLYRRLPAHARHAGNVVRLVPLQRLDLRYIFRSQPLVAFLHSGYVIRARPLSAGVEQHSNRGRHQLQYVAVTRENERVEMLRLRLRPQRSQYVISLVPRHFEDRHIERLHELLHAPELVAQFRRSWRTLRLVLVECLVPKCGRGHVESNDAV